MSEKTPEQINFEEAARPLIKYLCDNWHPHTIVNVNCAGAELLEGSMNFPTDEYILD